MTTAVEVVEGSASRPGRTLPQGENLYPFYRRLGGPQGQSGEVLKISLPPGFDPRTVHPVVRRYIDYATLPTVPRYSVHKDLSSRLYVLPYHSVYKQGNLAVTAVNGADTDSSSINTYAYPLTSRTSFYGFVRGTCGLMAS